MSRPTPKQRGQYTINTHIRDITEQELKEYAAVQGMSLTGVLNAAIKYCIDHKIDLAIWQLKEMRKATETE